VADWRHGELTPRTATRTGRAAAFATGSEPAYSSGLRVATAVAARKNSRRVRAGIRSPAATSKEPTSPGAYLTGADLTGANLAEVNVKNVVWSQHPLTGRDE